MAVKMNLRIITKNLQADPEIRFLVKSNSKPYGRATAMPPAWELSAEFSSTTKIRNILHNGYLRMSFGT